MGRDTNAGRGGRGGNSSGRGGRGRGGRGRGANATVPRKASEVGACKELEGHIFTIGSGNKGKDGDMLRTSMDKMATYIGTKFGDEAAQEWISGKKIITSEPSYSLAIKTRHAARVKATKDRLDLKLTGLTTEKAAIQAELLVSPSDRALLRELREVEDQMAKAEIDLTDEVDMKLTEDEKISHSNAWRSHRETTESLKKSRGKVYSLLLGQCTQVLVDKMKQDTDWVAISESFDPTLLFKLIEKFVLKQSDNQYATAVLIAEQLSILTFRQDDHLGNASYYDRFTTRVEVARQAGVCYYSPALLEDKATQLKLGGYDTLAIDVKKTVIDLVEQEYLAYLFLNNSNAKLHSQLKKDVANDYSKGNTEAYPTDIHKALTLMNEYKPLKLNTPTDPAQGTAFATKGSETKKKSSKGAAAGGKYLKAAEWNALSSEEQQKIIESRSKSKGDDDDKSTSSSKSIKSLSKTLKSLEKSNRKLKKSVSALQKCNEDGEESSISSSEGSNHFQMDLDLLEERNPKIVLALKSSKNVDLDLRNVLLLDNQSTFDLCCNKKFTSQITKATNALTMTSNGGGLRITEKCKIPGYRYPVWYSKKAITNIICLKNLIKCYRVTYDSEVDTTFVVHRSASGLPDLLFEMHPCGLHVCYPKKMGQFGFVQTVQDNMKLFSKRQLAGAHRARELHERLLCPSTSDYRAIVSAGGVPGSDVTLDDVKAAEVIWGRSVLKMKGNMTRKNGKRMTQSIVKVPTELIKLHKNVELAIDCFFVNKHTFFTTISTKICFTTITHLTKRNKEDIWVALLATYKMYLMRGFRIVVVKGDQEFASISDLVAGLPTMPRLDWAAASQHCGLIERNIRFLKEKIRSLRHSVPFERVPGIMVVRMVLHVVKFVNGFPRRGGPKLYSPGEIMTDRRLHADDLRLGFGTYCQVAEHVEPRNSLAPRTRAAISLGNSGNLSGGQVFLALDTGHTITRHQWVELPMPPAVIARVNVLGKAEPSILTFTDRHGREIGDYSRDEPVEDDNGLDEEYDYIDDFLVESQDDNEIPGVPEESPDEPTGVEVDPEPNETNFEVQDGLKQEPQEPQETSHELGTERQPTSEPTTAPVQGMAARNARVRKPPKKYVPTMKGNKYAVALTQISKSLKKSTHGLALAQMSVKLMSKGEHRRADIVGKVMAQLSMKAAIKKWGEKAKFAISKEMKQLHWRNSYVPKHYHTLTKKQKDRLLESHIFVEEKRDGTIKARKVIGGNKQRDYITKQDVSSPTVTAEAVMLTCVIDAQENRDVAVVDIEEPLIPTKARP